MHRWFPPPLPQRDTDESTLLLPKTAAHVTPRGFSEEPSLQRLLFAFPLSAAASHLDARQKRREKKKKNSSLLLLNNLSIKTKPERQPRAGRLFCLMLNIPRLGQHAPECRERVQGPGVAMWWVQGW